MQLAFNPPCGWMELLVTLWLLVVELVMELDVLVGVEFVRR